MGLLEYQAVPSLRDVAELLMTVFCVHLVVDQPQTGKVVWSVRASGMDRPSWQYYIQQQGCCIVTSTCLVSVNCMYGYWTERIYFKGLSHQGLSWIFMD
jgi:hypothetical protein